MIKFIKIVLVIFSLFLIFLILYKLKTYNKLYDITAHKYYLKYYFISFSLLIFSFLIKFFHKDIVIRIFLVSLSITTGFYLIEITLNLKEFFNRGYDKRSIFKVYKDELKINKNTTITLPPMAFLNRGYNLLPLSHISNNFIIDCNELGYYAINKSDKYGFNNENETWNKKIDFVVIGDSFSYGQCVFRKNNIVSNLELVERKNILNLSMPGNGLLLNFAILKEYLPNIKTNNILWFINDMDFENLVFEKKEKILLNYLYMKNFSQDLINNEDEILKIQNDLFKKRNNKLPLESFLLLNKTKIFVKNIYGFISNKTFDKINYNDDLEKISRNIFDELGILKNKGYNIYIIHIPIKNKIFDKNYNDKFRVITKELSEKNDLNFVNVEEIFEKLNVNEKLNFYSKYHGHFTEEGYKKISDYIYKNLN